MLAGCRALHVEIEWWRLRRLPAHIDREAPQLGRLDDLLREGVIVLDRVAVGQRGACVVRALRVPRIKLQYGLPDRLTVNKNPHLSAHCAAEASGKRLSEPIYIERGFVL